MKVEQLGDRVILTEYDSFNIEETLECGQCFRFLKVGDKEYHVIAFGKRLHVKEYTDRIEMEPTNINEFNEIWSDYFDLSRDYGEIKTNLSQRDEILKGSIDFGCGIRILKQQPFECLISFIISQNNRIPMIKQVISNISEKYGTQIEGGYAFPTVEQLAVADLEGLAGCKTGFRAKYIMDCVKNVINGNINIDEITALPTDEAKKKLMTIYGVGEKVADCALLFSFSRHELFPVDVWVRRIMQHFYFSGKEAKLNDIRQMAVERYGELAGFAQQYLFHFARQNKIT